MPSSRLETDPRAVVAVALGGLVGGPLRYALGEAWPDEPGRFPWTTFGINVSGAFLLGLLLVLVFEAALRVRYLREFAAVGVLGSFTTFSTWMVQARGDLANGHVALAVAYLAGSLVAGLAAGVAGIAVGRAGITRKRGH